MTSEEISQALPMRITSRILVDESGCLLWMGTISEGYGLVKWNGKQTRVHRLVYEHVNGSIPDGLTLDHLCRIRNCVNPRHLEPVTREENVLRGEAPSAVNARKTHCKRGHPFDSENTQIVKNGKDRKGRNCRQCQREWGRRNRIRTGAAHYD